MTLSIVLATLLVCAGRARGGERADVVVAVNGGGNFRSLQDALASVEQRSEPVVILIRNGLYREKIFIRRSHVTLVGEDQDSTRIVYAELRENWNKDHDGKDWGSGVVNIDTGVTDITLANLTVYNNYGWTQRVFNKHQFAIRGAGTRIMLLHCSVISDGGDALSLWNTHDGMYYHTDCFFEGWVDYVCPRGWCYVAYSRFFGHNKSASIWHDGSGGKDQKFVVTNSYFDGVPGFPLGRHHRDGQFFLMNCRFSRNMADRPIYFPKESPNAVPWVWGQRHYYYNCVREDGNFGWLGDNLDSAEGSPHPDDITARWVFGGRWDPEATMPSVLPFALLPAPARDAKNVPVTGARLSWVAGRNAESHNVYLGTTEPLAFMGNQKPSSCTTGQLQPGMVYYWRVDEVTAEEIIRGQRWSFRTQETAQQ